jgi:hypothetical protein
MKQQQQANKKHQRADTEKNIHAHVNCCFGEQREDESQKKFLAKKKFFLLSVSFVTSSCSVAILT